MIVIAAMAAAGSWQSAQAQIQKQTLSFNAAPPGNSNGAFTSVKISTDIWRNARAEINYRCTNLESDSYNRYRYNGQEYTFSQLKNGLDCNVVRPGGFNVSAVCSNAGPNFPAIINPINIISFDIFLFYGNQLIRSITDTRNDSNRAGRFIWESAPDNIDNSQLRIEIRNVRGVVDSNVEDAIKGYLHLKNNPQPSTNQPANTPTQQGNTGSGGSSSSGGSSTASGRSSGSGGASDTGTRPATSTQGGSSSTSNYARQQAQQGSQRTQNIMDNYNQTSQNINNAFNQQMSAMAERWEREEERNRIAEEREERARIEREERAAAERAERERIAEAERRAAAEHAAYVAGRRTALRTDFSDSKIPVSVDNVTAPEIWYFAYSNSGTQVTITNVFPIAKRNDGSYPFKNTIMSEISGAATLVGWFFSQREAEQARNRFLQTAQEGEMTIRNIAYKGRPQTADSATTGGDFWGTGAATTPTTPTQNRQATQKDSFWD